MVDNYRGADMQDEGRIALLERRTERLSDRVERLEAALAGERRTWLPPEAPKPRAERAAAAPRAPSAPKPSAATPGAPSAAKPPRPAAAAPGAPSAPRPPQPTRPRPDHAPLEDLVAGRVLAWAGGAAVFVGLILLFAVAISRGWVGESERTLLGGLACLALTAVAAWLHERRGRTDATMAAASAGIAGLFATAVVASRVYELVPVPAGLLLALCTGAAAVALALRWQSRGMATLGVLGGLAAPLLVGAPAGGGTVAMLFAATAAAVAICVHERWDWLGLAAFTAATPQWALGAAEQPPGTAELLLVLAAFGVLFALAAVGHDLRTGDRTPRPPAVLLLALNAFVIAAGGWALLSEHAGATVADAWLAAVAIAHLAGGLALVRDTRASRPLAVAALALGAVVADVALAQALSGIALALVWSGAAVGLAAAFARLRLAAGELEDVALASGLGGHVALALLHVLLVEAPPEAIAAGERSLAAAAGVATLAAACFASGALLDRRPDWRDLLNALGLAALAYLAAVALDGAALAMTWAAEAAALAAIARRAKLRAGSERREAVAAAAPDASRSSRAEGNERGGPAADSADPLGPLQALRRAMGADWVAGAAVPLQLALAFGGAVVLAAPWQALVDGLADVPAASGAMLAVAAAAFVAGRAATAGAILDGDRAWRVVLDGAGVAALVWLAVVSLDGAVLVAVLAAAAAALAELGRRTGDIPATAGAAAVLGLALGYALAGDATPRALLDGAANLAGAALGLTACALAAWRLALAAPPEARNAAAALAAAVPLHLASIALVTAAGAGQQAQMLLSALWAGVGVVALIAGLVRDNAAVRSGALALIAIALAKVFLYDLATLEAMARVASFLALGLLLLAGAFAWQRIRPRPLPDLREAPPGARG